MPALRIFQVFEWAKAGRSSLARGLPWIRIEAFMERARRPRRRFPASRSGDVDNSESSLRRRSYRPSLRASALLELGAWSYRPGSNLELSCLQPFECVGWSARLERSTSWLAAQAFRMRPQMLNDG